jgi:uncharacterized phage protein gp47/JayE
VEEILKDMLNEVSNTYDKRPGSFIYDSFAPVAKEFEKRDKSLQETKDKLSVENLEGDELAQYVKERSGIDRHQATFAIGVVTVTGNGTVYAGDLFETEEGVQFQATETKDIVDSGSVNIEAVVSGPSGNVPAQTITLFPVTLEGINTVTNPDPTYDGFEAESDVDLLQRYYERIRTPATSGNRYHYLNWSKEVAGVGDAKVFPLWRGDNTVKVVIIDADKKPASVALVDLVQDYIDPGTTGLGDGEAPIGAFCTVSSATGVNIDVSFSATLEQGYTSSEVDVIVSKNITEHLKEIAFQQDYVSYAQIGSIVLNSEGVKDYTDLSVNGGTANVNIAAEEVAVLGGVTIV